MMTIQSLSPEDAPAVAAVRQAASAHKGEKLGPEARPSFSPLWAEAACRTAATDGASSGERGWIVIMAGLLDWTIRMRAQPFAHWAAASLAKAA